MPSLGNAWRQSKAVAVLVLGALFGWAFLWPLTFIVPRIGHRVVVLGRDGGRFIDNGKHVFIGLQRPEFQDVEAIFLTDIPGTRRAIAGANCRVGPASGLAAWWLLLRCGTALVDSMDWGHSGRFGALRGARVVQLWHGIPLKRIELLVANRIADGLPAPLRPAFRAYRALIARHRRVDCVVSTSTFVAHEAMMRCFLAKAWPATGYPRNDILFDSRLKQHPLMAIGVDAAASHRVQAAKTAGQFIVLYAPTFRKHLLDPFSSGALDLHALNRFANSINTLFLIKLHPWMRQPQDSGTDSSNIVLAAPDSDIYPLLPEVDLLVTDYSSIFFDYLLLDRPIIYFCHDLDDYLAEDRGFIFDYAAMTPGPKVRTQAELEREIRAALTDDARQEERARVRGLVFDNMDGQATERLMSFLGFG